MENVITSSRANISNFFYKRKLNVYNLTAHLLLNKCAYNTIWPESLACRGSSEISSALCVIVKKVLEDYPRLERIILRSDSCLPQNKNSIMVTDLKHIIQTTSINVIEQKFSEAGHSCIQEVDNVHSHIDKALDLSEIFSPVSLLRVLLKVRPKHMKIIQLKQKYFLNFQKTSKSFNFSAVPFTKLKHISLEKCLPFRVSFK